MFKKEEILRDSVDSVGELGLRKPLSVLKTNGYDSRDPKVATTDEDEMVSDSIQKEIGRKVTFIILD